MYWKDDLSFWRNLVRQPKFGLVTDFDGTLSPIVEEPELAQIKPDFLPLLSELHHKISLVGVLSGRRAFDVQQRIGLPGLVYIGNHGIEQIIEGELILPEEAKPFEEVISAAKEEIHTRLLPGMMLEDKFITLSIHYRNADQLERVEARFLPFIESLALQLNLELNKGRKVYELRPPIKVSKGTAFRQLVLDFNVQSAVYLGDDTTDAAAFRVAQSLREEGVCRSFGIGVHSKNTPTDVLSSEDYYVEGVDGVIDFLTFLVSSLKASST